MVTTNETLMAVSLWLNMVIIVLVLVFVCYSIFAPSKKEMEFLKTLTKQKIPLNGLKQKKGKE